MPATNLPLLYDDITYYADDNYRGVHIYASIRGIRIGRSLAFFPYGTYGKKYGSMDFVNRNVQLFLAILKEEQLQKRWDKYPEGAR